MAKYTVGIDFGSLSGRAVLVDTADGTTVASAVYEYPHGVMSDTLPGQTNKLPVDFALQHPQDYLDVVYQTVPKVIKESGVKKEDIIAIGVDFTACTVLPTFRDGTPLCFDPRFADNPHAYVKMWKHHAAQDQANRLNETARIRNEYFVQRYGGKISSEWYFPKLWQILEDAPQIYDAMDFFIEATDWITWKLCGTLCRSSCTAGYKALWHKKDGDISPDFLGTLNPKLRNAVAEKLNAPVKSIGTTAGMLTEQMAEKIGLCASIPVAVGSVDAHVAIPAAGITDSNKMLAIVGTSTCHMMLSDKEVKVPGMCGVVEDGIIGGFFGYESGQSCVGDHFDWFMENCCPACLIEEAKAKGMKPIRLIEEKAAAIAPGESGLLALDWWNGNRSILVDVDLTGLFLGMTLSTKPEEMYRSLVEATAYGTRTIIENYRRCGLAVDEFYACGGISQKSPLTMQIYADVLSMEVKIVDSDQAPALGTAIFAAAIAGKKAGGYDDIATAAQHMSKIKAKTYRPDPKNVAIYDKLFREYSTLHDYFGKGMNDVMKRLKKIKEEQR